ncbi:long-chain fatty acid transport protein 2-like [Betta splendens]|uniref:long-chain-fatty-acid--CoA ligase n=1 Tax=Betta splendens TaxID=158456 RepID=A0A6P7MQ87_BETSP|nr:long-chain fatty acid transport protein 2-like [Betta splendens]
MFLLWIALPAVLCLAFLFRFPYFIQDVQHFIKKLTLVRRISKFMQSNYTLLDRFLERVETHPHKPFILFNDETFTFKDADELSNKAARAFLRSGCVKEGDTVTLFHRNEPMFVWLWLALVKLGCPVAFLNYNIRSKSLLHCFNRSGAKTLVVGRDLQDAVEEVLPTLLEQRVTVLSLADSKTDGIKNFADQMSEASSEPVPKDLRSHVTLLSPGVYIYTSGTTGLPKAAVMTHSKLWNLSWLLELGGTKSEDVLYVTLPLYHSVGFAGIIAGIDGGFTVALKSAFSASQFWDDCRRYNVTVILYIGEIMRYLCNKPKKLNERSHSLRLAIGNGMRADVWREFLKRFGNIRITEFYGGSELNFALFNYVGKIGSIGRHTFLNGRLYGLIKYDVYNGEPVRDSSGLCVAAAKGEPGLLVSRITQRAKFYGYLGDPEQTEKKKLHDVFEKGDVYFNTGDLMRKDEDNFLYFLDRTGDTFRCKGENVASTEVGDVMTLAHCIKEACVYGVQVPGQEGRVGMAALALRDGQMFDSTDVWQHVKNLLPDYARPRFLRIQSSLDVTGTFKHTKLKLMEEGFNPNQITDTLYFLDKEEQNYVPLTSEIFNSITSGEIQM